MASPLFPLLDVPENIMPLPPRLANDAEVQRLIADERMRTEQHRMNYLVLKTEHTRYKCSDVLLICLSLFFFSYL